MANPHKGEVEIKLQKAVSKGYLKTHGRPIYLRFDYNAMSDAEEKFKGDRTVPYILNKSQEDPSSVSFDDLRILLAEGLRHMFPAIDKYLAGNILNVEDFEYVSGKVGDALTLGMSGNIISEDDVRKGKDYVRGVESLEGRTEKTEGVEEGVEAAEIVEDDAKN